MSDDASAIKATPSVEAEINAAQSVSQISEILHRAALDQKLYEPDPYDRDGKDWSTMRIVPQPAQQAAQTAALSKTITVNGITYALTGTAEDLTRLETELYRAALQTKTAPSQEQPRDAASGRFAAQPTQEELNATATESARQADLQLKFQLGQISASDYLTQSGAIEQHLERRAAAETNAGWESATAEFKQSEEGGNWPGGEAMRERLGQILTDNNLTATDDKLGALKKAWAIMQKEDYEASVNKALESATDFESIKNAVGYRGPDGSSGMWGR